MKPIVIIASVIVVIGVLLWIGIKMEPASFKPFPQQGQTPKTVPLPDGLPAPVERFYKAVYGDQIPVIESAVVSGKALVRPTGVPTYLQARFRFTHIAGQSYRHYIEVTVFGMPTLKINERYVDGKSLFDIPGIGSVDDGPKTNQGANLGMWSETIWFPALYLTDPRVRWEAVDDVTAILVVPFDQSEKHGGNHAEEHYVVRFDPKTGLVSWLESMRYHAEESDEKVLWMNQAVEWTMLDGKPFQKSGAAIWMDDGKPWAIFNVEEIVYNVDIGEYILAKGE